MNLLWASLQAPAMQAALLAGLPASTPCTTVNKVGPLLEPAIWVCVVECWTKWVG